MSIEITLPNIIVVEVITDAFTIITLNANKKPIAITPTFDEEFIISNWQTAPVPGDTLSRTYAQRFGNNIVMITNRYSTPIGSTTTPVEFYAEYDEDELLIETVTIPANVLNTGFLNIIS